MTNKKESFKILSDNNLDSVKDDQLEYKSFAKAPQYIVTNTETPLVVGVFGSWGIGKTSLMKMTKSLLESDNSIADTIWFDAWKYEKKYDLRIALIHRILKELKKKHPKFGNKIRSFINSIDWVNVMNIPVNIALNSFGLSSEKIDLNKIFKSFDSSLDFVYQFEDKFNELIEKITKNGEKRIIIFIDDLDRCDPENIVETLEAVKLFLSTENVVFVAGFDREIIRDGIKLKYKSVVDENSIDGYVDRYLDKIIQAQLNLPAIRKEDAAQYIKRIAPKAIKKYAEILAEAGKTPRRIKKAVNKFIIMNIIVDNYRNELEPKVNKDILAKLVVLETRWSDFYDRMLRFTDIKNGKLISLALKEISKIVEITDKHEREEKIQESFLERRFFKDSALVDFLKESPVLWNIDLEPYIYLSKISKIDSEGGEAQRKNFKEYFFEGDLLYLRNKYEKAIQYYNKVIERHPEYAEVWEAKGNALYSLKKYKEAIECYDKVIEIDPKYADAWYDKGVALAHLKKYKEAIECYNKAIDMHPGYAAAWYNKACVYSLIRNKNDSLKSLQKAIKLDKKYKKLAMNNKNCFIDLRDDEDFKKIVS